MQITIIYRSPGRRGLYHRLHTRSIMQYSSDQTQVSDGLDHIHPVIQYKILHIPSCGYFLHEISLPAILFYKTYQEIHIFSRH